MHYIMHMHCFKLFQCRLIGKSIDLTEDVDEIGHEL